MSSAAIFVWRFRVNSSYIPFYPDTANVKSTSEVTVSLLSPSNVYSSNKKIIKIGTGKKERQTNENNAFV